NEAQFRAAADVELNAARAKHRLDESRDAYRGVTVEQFTTPDRAISLHRTFVDGFAIYSNSDAALRRVLNVRAGASKSLADMPDFRLFRSVLDGGRDEVLAYASERFLRRQFGPAPTVNARRRGEALAVVKALQCAAVFVHQAEG